MSGQDGSGRARGTWPTTSTPCEERLNTADTTIAATTMIDIPGARGAKRLSANSATMLASPTIVVTSCASLTESITFDPLGAPNSAGSCLPMITRPSPNRNPIMTGLETKSEIAPRPRAPPSTRMTPARTASAADSSANSATSPCASGATAAALSAEVAVVALTISVREVPSSAYPMSAPGAAIRPASGGSPAICP